MSLATAPATDSPSTQPRLWYLDNLRATAMMLGVFLHGALSYAEPSQDFWLIGDREGSVSLDAMIWFIHLFRMSLFFAISGYLSSMMLERRGVKGFLWNRVKRIVFPFLIFWPLMIVAYISVIQFALNYVQELTTVLAVIKSTPEGTPPPPPTTMHLWFLYYLMMFCLLAVGFQKLPKLSLPLMNWIKSKPWLLFFMPLMLIPSIVVAGNPLPAPESFIPEWWPFFYHGLFFLAGWLLRGREDLLKVFDRFVWVLLAFAVVLYVAYYILLPSSLEEAKVVWSTKRIIESTLAAYLSSILTIVAISLGKRYCNFASGPLRFVSDSSYWIYLIHVPLLLLMQTFLVDYHWSVFIKLGLSLIATLGLGIVSYALLVRWTPIGWLLNGRRKRTKSLEAKESMIQV